MLKELSKMYFEEGLRCLSQNKINTAQVKFKNAIVIDETNWEAFNFQGVCLYILGEFNEAKMFWQNSVNINCMDNNKAKCYIESLDEKEFLEFCDNYNKALDYAKKGCFKEAEKILEYDNFDQNQIVTFLNLKGLCKFAEGKKSEARVLWQKTLNINKEDNCAMRYIINGFEEKENIFYKVLHKIFKKL